MKYFRSTPLLLFFGLLHLLPMLKVWQIVEGRIAPAVLLISLIPLGLAGACLLNRPLRLLDALVLAYVVWSAASVVLYLQPANPASLGAYAFGVYHLLLPVSCYFAAKSVARDARATLVSGLALINVVALAYALLLHFLRPGHYVAFITEQLLAVKGYTDDWQFFSRLQSHLGSTSAGYLGAVTIVLLAIGKRSHMRFLPLAVPICIAVAALSMQRSSMVGAAIALLYIVFLVRRHAFLRLVAVAAVAVALVFGLGRFQDDAGDFGERLKERSTSDLVDAFTNLWSDRGYAPGWRYLSAFPLGVGLGATSSAADTSELTQWGEVADANLMRIGADLGVAGLLLFLLLLLVALRQAMHSQHPAGWLTFLGIHLGVMIGTNILDSYFVSHSFWLLLAVIDEDQPIQVRSAASRDKSPPLQTSSLSTI